MALVLQFAPASPSGDKNEFIWVSDYVEGDGSTNDSAAYKAASDDAISEQKPLVGHWPGHTICLDDTVEVEPIDSDHHNHFCRIIGPYAGFQSPNSTPTDASVSKILCRNASGPALRIRGSDSAGVKRPMVDGLKIWAGVDRPGVPLLELGDPNGVTAGNPISDFWMRDVMIDGRAADGWRSDGILVHTAFNGSFRDVKMQGMAGGIGWRVRQASAVNTGNLVWDSCQVNFSNPASLGAGIGWMLKEYYYDGATLHSGNLLNSIDMRNCKIVGPVEGTRKYNTIDVMAVSGAFARGVSVVTVDDASNVQAGQVLTFSRALDGAVWCDFVTSVSGNDITLRSGSLAGDLANNDIVVIGNWHTVLGDTVRDFKSSTAHLENASGLFCSSVGKARFSCYVGNLVPRGVMTARACVRVKADGHGNGNQIVLPNSIFLHQLNDSANSRNAVIETNLSDLHWNSSANGGAPVNPKVIVNDGGGDVGYRDTTTWTNITAGASTP